MNPHTDASGSDPDGSAPIQGSPAHRRTTLELFSEGSTPRQARSQWLHATFDAPGPEEAPAALCIDLQGEVHEATDAARTLLRHAGGVALVGRHLSEVGLLVADFEEWQKKVVRRPMPVPGCGRLVSPGRLPRSVAVTGLFLAAEERIIVWVEAPPASTSTFRVADVAAPDLMYAIDGAAEAAHVGIAINTLSADGRLRLAYINGAGARMLGRPAHELIAGAPFPPKNEPLRPGEPSMVAWPGPAGERILEYGVSSGHYGGLDAHFVIFTDVTAGQPNEAERKRLVQELFNANVDLRNFARATTHDLRAPLRSISGFAALLERRIRGRLDDDDVRLIRNIIASTKRMDELVEALAAFSAIGAHQFESSQVELNTILGDVLSDLASELDSQDIHLEFKSLPSVHGDALMLRQLFQNLLGNAVKFRHKVPHRVHLDAAVEDDWLELRFIDNGIGIDLVRANDLFQPFRRFHDLSKFPGSGLGLATCKRIVEAHGGTIEVASEPRIGSTFTVRLPR